MQKNKSHYTTGIPLHRTVRVSIKRNPGKTERQTKKEKYVHYFILHALDNRHRVQCPSYLAATRMQVREPATAADDRLPLALLHGTEVTMTFSPDWHMHANRKQKKQLKNKNKTKIPTKHINAEKLHHCMHRYRVANRWSCVRWNDHCRLVDAEHTHTHTQPNTLCVFAFAPPLWLYASCSCTRQCTFVVPKYFIHTIAQPPLAEFVCSCLHGFVALTLNWNWVSGAMYENFAPSVRPCARYCCFIFCACFGF